MKTRRWGVLVGMSLLLHVGCSSPWTRPNELYQNASGLADPQARAAAYEEALAAFQKAERESPSDLGKPENEGPYRQTRKEVAKNLCAEAKACADDGGFEIADKLLVRACQLDAGNDEYVTTLNDIRTRARVEMAGQLFNKAMQVAPDDLAESIELLKQARELDPENDRIAGALAEAQEEARARKARQLLEMALVAADTRDLDAAGKFVGEASALNPDDVDVREALASLVENDPKRSAAPAWKAAEEKMAAKDWEGAVHGYVSYIEQVPHDLLAWSRKAEANAHRKQGESLFSAGAEALEAGKLRMAMAQLEACEKQSPFHPKAGDALKEARRRMDQFGQALAKAKQLRDKEDWNALADQLREVNELYPHDEEATLLQVEVHQTLADKYLRSGWVGNAIVHLAQALHLSIVTLEDGNDSAALQAAGKKCWSAMDDSVSALNQATRTRLVAGFGDGSSAEEYGPAVEDGFSEALGKVTLPNFTCDWDGTGGAADDLVVSLSLQARPTPVKKQEKSTALQKEYISGSRPNLEHSKAERELERARSALERKEAQLEAAQEAALESSLDAFAGNLSGRDSGASSRSIDDQTKVMALQEEVGDLRGKVVEAEQRLRNIPAELPVTSTHRYHEVNVEKTANAVLEGTLSGLGAKKVLKTEASASDAGRYFRNPAPALGIPDDQPNIRKDAELMGAAFRDAGRKMGEQAIGETRGLVSARYQKEMERLFSSGQYFHAIECSIRNMAITSAINRIEQAIDAGGVIQQAAADQARRSGKPFGFVPENFGFEAFQDPLRPGARTATKDPVKAETPAPQEDPEKLLAAGKTKEAIAVLEALIRERPQKTSAWFLLGTAYEAEQNADAAARAYAATIALNPAGKNAGEAGERLSRLQTANPGVPSVPPGVQKLVIAAGERISKLGARAAENPEEVERIAALLQQAISEARWCAEAYISLGALYQAIQKPDIALECLNRYLAMKPNLSAEGREQARKMLTGAPTEEEERDLQDVGK